MVDTGKEESLRRARSLLIHINNNRKLHKGDAFRHSQEAAETLTTTIRLLQSLHLEFAKEASALDPSSQDWKVLKALLELLVRLGISPHLSPAVGILQDRRQDGDGRSISFQFSALSISSSQSAATAPLAGTPLFFTCAETLCSFFWADLGSSVARSSPPSLHSFSQKEETVAATLNAAHSAVENSEETSLGDLGIAEFPIQQNTSFHKEETVAATVNAAHSAVANSEEPYLGDLGITEFPIQRNTSSQKEETVAATMNATHSAVENSEETSLGDLGITEFPIQQNRLSGVSELAPLEASCPLTDAHSLDDTQLLPFLSTRELAMKFFSWDLMAAYLQLGFSPSETNEHIRYLARDRLRFMVEHLPVEQMVVASFLLLNRASSTPQWLKRELGKNLSKLVMRRGGLVIILEELVGRATKGSVESYDKVTRHLAKVPKSVATVDTYLMALSSQLLPLLLLKHKPRASVLGEIARSVLNNIFHTSVSLTCKIFSLEPAIATKYVIKPIMKPLLALSSMQKSVDTAGCLPLGLDHGEPTNTVATENEVVDSLVQLSVLLTAGSEGSSLAREIILLEAKAVALALLRLHFQLDPKHCSNCTSTSGSTSNTSINKKNSNLEKKGLRKGFLDENIGYSGSNEEAHEDHSNFSKLYLALSDVIMAAVNQPVESALPFVLPFVMEHTLDVVRWPEEQGEVWETLQSKKFLSSSKMMYLSKLLIMVENWPLVVALMGKLLHLTLNAPWLSLENGYAEYDDAAELFRYMQDFEELNREAGLKALEYDTGGAASMVKALLDDELIYRNKDLLELVLHMVYSVLKGIRASTEDDLQTMNALGSVLTGLLSSLQRLCQNTLVDEKLRQISSTLSENITALCREEFG